MYCCNSLEADPSTKPSPLSASWSTDAVIFSSSKRGDLKNSHVQMLVTARIHQTKSNPANTFNTADKCNWKRDVTAIVTTGDVRLTLSQNMVHDSPLDDKKRTISPLSLKN